MYKVQSLKYLVKNITIFSFSIHIRKSKRNTQSPEPKTLGGLWRSTDDLSFEKLYSTLQILPLSICYLSFNPLWFPLINRFGLQTLEQKFDLIWKDLLVCLVKTWYEQKPATTLVLCNNRHNDNETTCSKLDNNTNVNQANWSCWW